MTHATHDATDDVAVRIDGSVGRLTLCRTSRLNALTHEMVRTMLVALQHWHDDPAVTMVLVDAAPGKAFCAGGDVKSMYRAGLDGDIAGVRRFFADEYRLNALIARYPKPYVALMDGITMGGGIGISGHGSHRIVTEHSVLAMPECLIGLVPDVGATHLLAKAPGHLGEYLALTGARLGADDALHAGLADHSVPSERVDALKVALSASGDPSPIASFATTGGSSALADRAQAIDRLFGGATLAEVSSAVEQDRRDWVIEARRAMAQASPLSLHLSFDLVRQARRTPGVEAALVREYRFVSRAIEQTDFLEGVRAALVDKDGAPAWRHAGLADIDERIVRELQAEAPGGDVRFDRQCSD